jgi:hypothetical protein
VADSLRKRSTSSQKIDNDNNRVIAKSLPFQYSELQKNFTTLNFGSLRKISFQTKQIILPLNKKHLRQVNNKFCFVCGREEKMMSTNSFLSK